MSGVKTALDPFYDVIVVGAGPAGAAAACYLKLFDTRSLLKVLLIEKHADPADYNKYHHKCGEGVSEDFLEEIAPIRALPSDIIVHVTKLREYWGKKPMVETTDKECILNRPAFLRHIIDSFTSAGGEIRWDEVLKVEIVGDCARIICKSGYTARGRVIIGADGPNSRIRNSMGFTKPLIITVVQYLVDNEQADDRTIIVWYGANYQGGYKYRFPYGPGKCKLGFMKGTAEYKGPFYELQAKQMAIGGMHSFVKDNVVLIGDSGAFTNPLTGGGIKVAFMAARVIAKKLVIAGEKATEKDRTSRLIDAINHFESWWKKSPYFSAKYMKAFERFRKMDDITIERFSEPFYKKGSIRSMHAFLKNIKYWSLYKAFWDSMKYS
nr:NAD(P)/FAD-dependent oxidoreductase [Candidatus Sigynarchaeum springense]MDO8118658.1 NAD(P)/FAD-dependent oxidoreductase [Candidatus Sigynarchaeota archaeon]